MMLQARTKHIGFGGARGGGKSWAVRTKAKLLALNYAGIKILIVRRTYPELMNNHIMILRAELNGIAKYNDRDKLMYFPNGSTIKFGYLKNESDTHQYQGAEYDVIFLDEATHFTAYQYATLTAALRGANDFPKRMYLTCNPGGVGHAWVKRLFIDRAFRAGERPEDYVFIPARVTDNRILVEKDPEYVRRLDNLPPSLRAAWRDGSWDVFAGQFFTEWNRDVHVCAAFVPPSWWRWYVTMDYGLDMLAALLVGVDEAGDACVVAEVYEGRDLGEGHEGLIVSEAAERVKRLAEGRQITAYLAPPDLWNARQESGRSVADIFAEHGVYLTKTSNARVDGWLAVKEWLKVREDGTARLRIFPSCRNLIRTLPLLQYDERRPNDAAGEPHELTHAPDALRGFCVYWTGAGVGEPAPERVKLIDRLGQKGKRGNRGKRSEG
jgi:phage terminase large subunit